VGSARLSARLFVAASLAGAVLANASVLVPLAALAHHGSPSVAGVLLAMITVAIALGALVASRPLARLGARNLLSASFLLMAAGQADAIAFGGAQAALALAALVVGAGLGLFWVASQVTLSAAAGRPGAERGFVRHYICYVVGSALGAPATGLAVHALRGAGAGAAASLHLAFVVGLVASLAGPLVWRPTRLPGGRTTTSASPVTAIPAGERRPTPRASARAGCTAGGARRAMLRGLSLQLPDLLLVSALSVLATLAPVVLTRTLHFTPAAVGLVVGALAAGKIGGSLIAERGARAHPRNVLVAAMLGLAAGCSTVLALATVAPLFVAMLVLAVLGSAGAWPVIVEAALGSVDASERASLTVAWNVREYGAVALSTVVGGWLLASLPASASLMLAAGALALAAALALAVLRREGSAATGRTRPRSVARKGQPRRPVVGWARPAVARARGAAAWARPLADRARARDEHALAAPMPSRGRRRLQRPQLLGIADRQPAHNPIGVDRVLAEAPEGRGVSVDRDRAVGRAREPVDVVRAEGERLASLD